MKSRRSFIRNLAALGSTVGLSGWTTALRAESVSQALTDLNSIPLEDSIVEDEIWKRIQQAYTVSPNIVNLNNGGVSPQPKVVQDAVDRYYHLSNEAPSYYMWRIVDQGREAVRLKLANLAGCSKEKIAINRNATEALDNAIFGMPLNRGDEVILSLQDYPNMINAWKQREKREGIKLVWLNLDVPKEEDQYFVDQFVNATTSRTKVYHITHMINWNGQILPAKQLCAEARKRGIKTVVDGAHTFAHFEFNIDDLGCDYFGTSLHKWLCAPFGTGMLYVNNERIAETWPLIPHHEPESADIRKFEALGTRSFAPEQAIGHAINFHLGIGSERKEKRLRFLKNYWCEKVKDHPKINIGTSLKDEFSCAIAVVDIDGYEPGEVSSKLFREHQIHTTSIIWENIRGVRITPHVYTMTYDLDRLVNALIKIADSK